MLFISNKILNQMNQRTEWRTSLLCFVKQVQRAKLLTVAALYTPTHPQRCGALLSSCALRCFMPSNTPKENVFWSTKAMKQKYLPIHLKFLISYLCNSRWYFHHELEDSTDTHTWITSTCILNVCISEISIDHNVFSLDFLMLWWFQSIFSITYK